eukprot:TRINITY_DN2402_c3_g1_i2.p1 TRINITY_DN2402_c3_g1~~TRINITY_DN2402_c3_g1_i2.p1  ORF type:complete len:251 (+),score=19.46 TRINITY_DN2402_c3_g1_i2:214-966(+)
MPLAGRSLATFEGRERSLRKSPRGPPVQQHGSGSGLQWAPFERKPSLSPGTSPLRRGSVGSSVLKSPTESCLSFSTQATQRSCIRDNEGHKYDSSARIGIKLSPYLTPDNSRLIKALLFAFQPRTIMRGMSMSGSTSTSSYNTSEVGAAQPKVAAACILDIIEYWLPPARVSKKVRRSVVCLQPSVEVIDYHSDEAKKIGKPTRLSVQHQRLDQVLTNPPPQRSLSTSARKTMKRSRPPQVKAGCECIIS